MTDNDDENEDEKKDICEFCGQHFPMGGMHFCIDWDDDEFLIPDDEDDDEQIEEEKDAGK